MKFKFSIFSAYTLFAFVSVFFLSGLMIATEFLDTDAVILFAEVMLFFGFCFLIMLGNKRSDALVFFVAFFSAYLYLAYVIKGVLTRSDPGSLWVTGEFFPASVVATEIVEHLLVIFPSFIALFVGLWLGNSLIPSKNFREKAFKIDHRLVVFSIVSLVLLRVISQEVLGIGIPGHRSTFFSVPFITGILDLLTRPGLMAAINLYFYLSLRSNDRKGVYYSIAFMIVNIALGLKVGYKTELVLQMVVLIYYLSVSDVYISKNVRSKIYLYSFVLFLVLILIYPLVNQYRQYRLTGYDFSSSVEKTLEHREKDRDNKGAIKSIFDRFNGVGAYYAAVKLGEGSEYGLSAFFSGEVMDLIKLRLYGYDKDSAVTAFGTTQFSVMYLSGGVVGLYIGCFFIGLTLQSLFNLVRNLSHRSSLFMSSYLPLYGILGLQFINSGGNVLLYLKEFILVVAVLYFIGTKCLSGVVLKEKAS